MGAPSRFRSFQFLTSIFVLFMGALALTGCALKEGEKRSKLEDSVKGYVKALKAKDQDGVLAFVNPKHQMSFAKNLGRLDNLEIASLDIQRIFPNQDLSSALVTLQLQYYQTSNSSLFATRRNFIWKYEKGPDLWVLDETTPLGRN